MCGCNPATLLMSVTLRERQFFPSIMTSQCNCNSMTYVRDSVRLIAFVLLACGLVAAQGRLDRYALILQDPPLAADAIAEKGIRGASPDRMRAIQSAQQGIRPSLRGRKIQTIGAIQTVLNAVFVHATPEQADTLK